MLFSLGKKCYGNLFGGENVVLGFLLKDVKAMAATTILIAQMKLENRLYMLKVYKFMEVKDYNYYNQEKTYQASKNLVLTVVVTADPNIH